MGEYAQLVQPIGQPAMNITETALPGVVIVEPKLFGDARGFFQELYHRDRYAERGIAAHLVQDNLSRSARGVLRGLHLQNPRPQGKLVTVLRGAVLDVAVDVRLGSPTFASHVAVELNEDNRRQLWIPRGFAHGFLVRSDSADFFYKCDDVYSPADELVLAWNDPQLAIDWGCDAPSLSARDREGRPLKELLPRLPRYEGA
jgi:dTDP-4-dehydrorhamnose 3,5-epimerase